MTGSLRHDELAAATRAWVEASAAVRALFEKYFATYRPETGEPAPEPKAVFTREALQEYHKLKGEEDKRREDWERTVRALIEES